MRGGRIRTPVALATIAVVLLGALLTGCPGPGKAVQLYLALVAQGLTSPVGLVPVDDGTGRLFVIDQVGQIHIIDADGKLLLTPFLDLSGRMVTLSPDFDERGLLGLAFHPDYGANGRFFVCYNAPLEPEDDENFNSRWRLSEFVVSQGDPNEADAGSEVVLLEVLKPQFNHNGGQLAFGPDGRLYASTGDGGAADDVGFGHTPDLGNGQDLTRLLGKILRLDVDTPGELNIPGDNPFVGDGAALDEIYAFGLRNPWRFSFDQGGTHRLFCADVGQNLYEEVNLVEPGGNYGWHIKEGTRCFDPDTPNDPPPACDDTGAGGEPLLDPIIEYNHLSALGMPVRLAAVGGYVYRGSAVPELAGRYVFGDWSSSFSDGDGTVYVAQESGEGDWGFSEAAIATEASGRLGRFLLAFGQDLDGEVYVLTTDNSGPMGATGRVWKVVPAP